MEQQLALGPIKLIGNLTIPKDPLGIVLFAHGSGSSRFSPRNQFVAGVFNERRIAPFSRGGRPDLAKLFLSKVQSPTLFIVGELDPEVIVLNRQAYDVLHCPKKIEIVPGATHLFEEKGCLQQVAELACSWFCKYIRND